MLVSYLGALGLVMTPCAIAVGLVLLAADAIRDARTAAGAPRALRAPFDHAESRPAPRHTPRVREDDLLDEPELDVRPRAQEVARAA